MPYFLGHEPFADIWFTSMGVTTMAFNVKKFNFNHLVVGSLGRVINTSTDILNRFNLGMEVLHERNIYIYPVGRGV